MKQILNAHEWWSRLRHQGLLLSPAVMVDRFGAPDFLDEFLIDYLRRSHDRFQASSKTKRTRELEITESNVLRFVDDLFEGFLKYSTFNVRKQGQIPDSLIASFQIGSRREPLRPHRVFEVGDATLLLMVDTNPQLGRGRGRTAYARLIELLRGTGKKLGILTNGLQIRLVYAGLDTESWCEWEVERWFDRGEGEEELAGLQQLLCSATLNPPLPTEAKLKRPSSLLEAIEESRKRQAELSSVLGEAVRRAVEHLTDELSLEARRDNKLLETLYIKPDGNRLTDGEAHDALMQASVRIVMRLVVCLFAESRGMLPTNDPIYTTSYGVRSLFDTLEKERQHEGGASRQTEYRSAWLRLVALFKLVHDGSRHASFLMPRYGGLLFRPGMEADSDPVLRALYILERKIPINDATVHSLLRKLMRGKLPVIVGRVKKEVEGPMDYTYLRTEFIGIIYEGVLDYKLKRASDSAQVFLNIGREPVLPLMRLEGMLTADPKGLKDLLTKLDKEKTSGKSDSSDADAADEFDDEETVVEPEVPEGDLFVPDEPATEPELESECIPFSPHADSDQRALAWAREAVKVAGLAPKKRKGETEYDYEKRVEAKARNLISRVVGNGEFYLVRAGNVRKGSGTFYTKPQLAVPTVHRTLEPLCYNEDKSPKTPTEILNLKVCDPACGSASFLVATLHYLTDALYSSLAYHCGLEDPARCMKIALPFGTVRTGALEEETVPFSPDDPKEGDQFPERIKAILRRHVVERCIYGVDINPLAVELARVSLWVDTMHRTLPFGFLDHKIKVGNALVGCWLDRVQDYPIAAWKREGGDGKDGERTNRIKVLLNGQDVIEDGVKKRISGVKDEMRSLIGANFRGLVPLFPNEETDPTDVVAEAKLQYDKLHSDVRDVESQEREYKLFIESAHYKTLKRAMDEWCAVWFWPMDAESAKHVPTPRTFHSYSAVGAEGVPPVREEIIERLVQSLKFFHWELEFPDVFTPERSGFDSMLGNPPWEVMKPNSHEFFSNYDPLYRTYDKQEALQAQTELFKTIPGVQSEWLTYCSHFDSLSTFCAASSDPYCSDLGKTDSGAKYTEVWSVFRNPRRRSFVKQTLFSYQGKADLNLYKLFTELFMQLIRADSRFGVIIPSGVYSDLGTLDLRRYFLEECSWEWLVSFDNGKSIFNTHTDQRFAVVICTKGGLTKELKVAFRLTDTGVWESANMSYGLYSSELVLLLSPESRAIPEIWDKDVIEMFRSIYKNSNRLCESFERTQPRYATEFHMSIDSDSFIRLELLESKGRTADHFGNFRLEDHSIGLPLYEGKMVSHFDPSFQLWESGAGKGSKWRSTDIYSKEIRPQFIIPEAVFRIESKYSNYCRVAFRNTAPATNERTLVAACLPPVPCGNSAQIYHFDSFGIKNCLILASFMCSFVMDFTLRQRLAGRNINKFIVADLPISKAAFEDSANSYRVLHVAARLTFIHRRFAPEWLKLKQEFPELEQKEWKQWWAMTEADRLRLRVEIDALCADLYGLDPDDFDWIVRDDPTDPKGFWRVDKQLPYAERLTGLAANAFRKLKEGKWSADSVGELSNDEFFELLGIPELTNEQAAQTKGQNQPLIMKRNGCHSWKPELFAESDPRHGWTWEHCKQDAIALLGSEKELEKYLKDEPTASIPTPTKKRKKGDAGQGELV